MLNIAMSPDQLIGLVKDAEGGGGFYLTSPDEDAVKAGQPRAWWEQVEIASVEIEHDPKGDNFPESERHKVSVTFRVVDEATWLGHDMAPLGASDNAGRSQTDRFYLTPPSEKDNLNTMTDISTGKLGQAAFAGMNLSADNPEGIPTNSEGKVDPLELIQQATGTFVWARFRRYRDDYTKAGESTPTEAYRTEFSQAMPIEVEG